MTTEMATKRTPEQELAYQQEHLEAANKALVVAERNFVKVKADQNATMDALLDAANVVGSVRDKDKKTENRGARGDVALATALVKQAEWAITNAALIAKQGAVAEVSTALVDATKGSSFVGSVAFADLQSLAGVLDAMLAKAEQAKALSIESCNFTLKDGVRAVKLAGPGVIKSPSSGSKGDGAKRTRVSGGTRGLWSSEAVRAGVFVEGRSQHEVISKKLPELHASIHAANPGEPCPYA